MRLPVAMPILVWLIMAPTWYISTQINQWLLSLDGKYIYDIIPENNCIL
jgi:hypothetical protein